MRSTMTFEISVPSPFYHWFCFHKSFFFFIAFFLNAYIIFCSSNQNVSTKRSRVWGYLFSLWKPSTSKNGQVYPKLLEFVLGDFLNCSSVISPQIYCSLLKMLYNQNAKTPLVTYFLPEYFPWMHEVYMLISLLFSCDLAFITMFSANNSENYSSSSTNNYSLNKTSENQKSIW